ncbi:N-acetylmuramoyl-L-alanine amidase [bacterium]|nr:N-acetylmuramoyl-L-alanine amidase [bacterium]
MISALVMGAVVVGDVREPMFLYRRGDWGAKPVVLEMEPHRIDRITIHHTGVAQVKTRPFFDKLRGLQAWSQREDELAGGRKKPQWADIPYHYYIDWRGDVAECRPIELPGDTNTTYDVRGHALVVIEGSFPTDEFNRDQRRKLEKVVLWLADRFDVPADRIAGHVDFAPGETDCPGSSVMEYLPELRRVVRAKRGK